MEYVEREQNVACLDTGCGHDYRLKWSESARTKALRLVFNRTHERPYVH